jgi:hypothetical protein
MPGKLSPVKVVPSSCPFKLSLQVVPSSCPSKPPLNDLHIPLHSCSHECASFTSCIFIPSTDTRVIRTLTGPLLSHRSPVPVTVTSTIRPSTPCAFSKLGACVCAQTTHMHPLARTGTVHAGRVTGGKVSAHRMAIIMHAPVSIDSTTLKDTAMIYSATAHSLSGIHSSWPW